MAQVVTNDPVLLAVISVLLTVSGILILAVVTQFKNYVKKEFAEIKAFLTEIRKEHKTLHHRQTKHVEDYHTTKIGP